MLKHSSSVLLVVLCGCSEPTSPAMKYLERVEAVFERDARVVGEVLPPFPPRRQLHLDIERQSIDVVEFARLHACDMGGLIGERNSGLGRLQTAGRRLIYELRWMAAAERCIATGQTWLEPVAAQKRAQLPAVAWNASFATDTFARAMGASAGAHSGDTEPMLGFADAVLRVVEGGRVDSAENLEAMLKVLADGFRVGRSRTAWQETRVVLGEVSRLLRDRRPPVCLSGKPTPRSERLLAVFRTYYLKAWQPRLAENMATDQLWINGLDRARSALAEVTPPAFDAWYRTALNPADPGSEWRRTQAALVAHAQAWNGLLRSCGLAVTDLGEVP